MILSILVLTLIISANSRRDIPNECKEEGHRRHIVQPLIINGEPAKIRDFPNQVYFLNMDSFCSATAITARVLVTAAHCFMKNKNVKRMKVIAGRTSVREFCIKFYPNTEAYGICNFKVHKKFLMNYTIDADKIKRHYVYNDIALIKLDRALSLSEKIKKGFLPKNEDFLRDFRKNRFKVAGWGFKNRRGEASSSLLQTRLSLVSDTMCEPVFNRSMAKNDVFCLMGRVENDVCYGDSGSGIQYRGHVVGITSYSVTKGCAKGLPTAYTNLYHYRPWIQRTLRRLHRMKCD